MGICPLLFFELSLQRIKFFFIFYSVIRRYATLEALSDATTKGTGEGIQTGCFFLTVYESIGWMIWCMKMDQSLFTVLDC